MRRRRRLCGCGPTPWTSPRARMEAGAGAAGRKDGGEEHEEAGEEGSEEESEVHRLEGIEGKDMPS